MLACLAVLGVMAAIAMIPKVSSASAETRYTEAYGGCTYSWGTPCYIWLGEVNYLITMDPDNASINMGTQYTFNGYPRPKRDGVERDLCGTLTPNETGGLIYPWTCNWGETVVTYPPTYGYTAIGGGNYHNIALYDVAGWGGF
jgi:hypothetical protein